MSWRLGILAAVLAWLFLASPAVLADAERANFGIEVRNGTRTQNLAHLTRTLLSLQGFNVVQIGNHIDFGAAATVIYYRTGAEKVARALQSKIFPGARLEESPSLRNGVDLKVLLGHDLEVQPRMMARLLGEELATPPAAVNSPAPESRPPPRSTAAKEATVPTIVSAPATAEPARPQIQVPRPVPAAASAPMSESRERHPDSSAILATAEKANFGIEVRNGTRTQNLAHLTRTLLSLQGFDVVRIGNHIDFGAAATVIYYRTGAEKVARALQSEIFPGARLETSPSLKNGVDLKVLLGHDLEVQPRMMARLLGEEQATPSVAVNYPAPESRPPPRSTAAKAAAAPVIFSAPATAEPARPQIQALPPLPAAASAPKSGALPRRTDSPAVLAAAGRADSGLEVRNGTRTQNLAHLTHTLLSQPDFNIAQIGKQIDFEVAAAMIRCRTEAKKVARARQSGIFPGARKEASSRLKNGVDLKVLLEDDLLAQPRMLALLFGEALAASPPAVNAPAPESGPLPRTTAAKEAAAPANVSAAATAEPAPPQIQAPPLVPSAESRTQNLTLLTRTLLSQPDFNFVRIGNQIDFGALSTVIYYRTEAEKVARVQQSEISPGARSEASARQKKGVELKVLLEDGQLAQPRMLARLIGDKLAASQPAVNGPRPESVPPLRSTAAKEAAAPVIVSAPATAELVWLQIQVPLPVPTDSRAVLAAVKKAAGDLEVRNGSRTQNLTLLTRTLLSQPDFNFVRIGNQIDFGALSTVIYYRTEAEKVARVQQSEISPGARSEASARQKKGVELKVLLEDGQLAQPRMLARLIGDKLAASQPAVNGPRPESVPPLRSTAAKEAAAPVIVSAPATAELVRPQIQAPPPVPAAASADDSGAIPRHTDSLGVLHIDNAAPSQPKPSQPDSPSAVREAMIAEPRRSQSRQVRLVGQTEETYTPEADLAAIRKACQGLVRSDAQAHEFDGIIAAAGQASVEKEAVEVALDYNHLPVRQASQDQEVIPALASQPAAPTTVAAATPGDIRRYCDVGGVLHIDNVLPSQPAPSQPDSPSVVREAMIAEPRGGQSRQVRLVGQSEETYTPEADLAAIQKTCQDLVRGETQAHEFDAIIAAAGQAVVEKEASEVALDYNYLPVRQVSQEQEVIPAPAPQPAAPTTAEAAAISDIQRHLDARGILHLSNAAPGAEYLGATAQMAQGLNNSVGEAKQLSQPVAVQPRPSFHQAAWSPAEARLATPPTTISPAKQAAPGSPSPIREYRDSKSVIHISNVDPKPREAPETTGLMARVKAAAEVEPQASKALFEDKSGLAWRPAAYNDEGGIKPLKRKEAAVSQPAEITTEGGIQRYRDKQGIIHIKTVEYPLPPGVVLPPRQASPSLLAPMAAAPVTPVVSNPPGSASSALPANPTTFSGAGARITAFKDAKGRLRISTELPPPVPGKLPPMPVYTELEPIILEAATIHRLPPTLIKAVIKSESNFCSWAVSPKGAMGLMQLMPGTADFLGVREPFNPRDNILGGCRYLRELIDMFGGNLPLALASYNAGFQRVIDCGYQIPAIKETQDFVTAVMGRYVAEEKRGRQPSI